MKKSTRSCFTSLLTVIAVIAVIFLLIDLYPVGACDAPPMEDSEEEEISSSCPTVRVSLLPMGDFTQQEAENLKKEMQTHLSEMLDVALIFDVLPTRQLADSFLNDAKTRYRADKIIRALEKEANPEHIIVALTHKDISLPYKDKPDWGVLGLSLIPKKACMVSTFRVKNRKDMWKVASHEFIHTCCQYMHCPDDLDSCIMKDAKGHANFSNKTTLCDHCKKAVNEKLHQIIHF